MWDWWWDFIACRSWKDFGKRVSEILKGFEEVVGRV